MMARLDWAGLPLAALRKFLSHMEKPQEHSVTVQPCEWPFDANFTDIENRFPLIHNLQEQMQRSNKSCGVRFGLVWFGFEGKGPSFANATPFIQKYEHSCHVSVFYLGGLYLGSCFLISLSK